VTHVTLLITFNTGGALGQLHNLKVAVGGWANQQERAIIGWKKHKLVSDLILKSVR
jgi:hypothetical protein